MNDIMKAIVILQSLCDRLQIRHTPKVPYGVDLSEEIEQLQEAIAMLSRLHDERERLRNLQAEDVTRKQVDQVADEYRWASRDMIAAAVRVIVASLDKTAGSE